MTYEIYQNINGNWENTRLAYDDMEGEKLQVFETFEEAQEIYGYYLMSVEIKCAADDDAFTVLITTNTGAPLFTHTTTAATTGELENATDRWPINAAPKIDITGLTAAKIVTVIVTFVK